MTAGETALLVGDIFRALWVPLPVHLGDCATKPGLRRPEEDDVLDIAVDKVVIIVLLKGLGSRLAEAAIPFLVGKCT